MCDTCKLIWRKPYCQNIISGAALVVLSNYTKHVPQLTPLSWDRRFIPQTICLLLRFSSYQNNKESFLTVSCIKQCHPLTAGALICEHWLPEIGSRRGNNNPNTSLSLVERSHSPRALFTPCWALSAVLLNVLLSCLDVIYVRGCEVDLSSSPPSPVPLPSALYSTALAPSVSASLAPQQGPGWTEWWDGGEL